ncbi:regulatory subunit of cyclin-dependent kinase [Thamnidium elegans]|nr:regulatory subunit of cyclin-dependent kinase [Thamnidium elegans]
MNQENKAPLKPNVTTKSAGFGIRRSNLMPKTVAEIAEVHARGSKLFVKKPYSRKDPNALPYPKERTEEEIKAEAAQRKKEINEYSKHIHYSSYYFDDKHEYRHVVLPKKLIRWLPHRGILTEEEWTSLGITQSTGWEHFMVYAPEPHILLFRREIDYLKKVIAMIRE